jgi:hypothetical protein
MKIQILSVCSIVLTMAVQAQPDTAKIGRNALAFADSLAKTDAYGITYGNWSGYADLNPASVIKYYGGKAGLIQHITMLRTPTISETQEPAPEYQLTVLENRDEQWQCVIRQSSYFHKEGTQYHSVTYLIGQSRDDGETWRLFDVSYSKVANIIYIFPEIMDDLELKDATVLSEDQEAKMAQQAAAKAPPARKRRFNK